MVRSDDEVLDSLVQPGIRVSKLKLQHFPSTGRGLAATSAIKKHEILLTIPPRYLLNLKIVGKEFNFDWRIPPIPAHVALALYILYHKSKSQSPLSAYIESLPDTFETVPLEWPETLIALLPTSTQAYLNKQQIVFHKHHTAAQDFIDHHSVPELSASSKELDFKWAWLVVNSRCIYQELSPSSTRDDNYACSPLIDMINHVPSSVPHCKLSYDIKGLSVISQSPYRAGEETFISYGAHSNEALLCEYGFVIPGNSDNCISIDQRLATVLQSHHQRLLMEMGYFEDYTIDHHGAISFRTEVALRAALLNQDDCQEGTDACRRLTQFVNGQNQGFREQGEVDMLLQTILEAELKDSRGALQRCTGTGANIRLIAQLWRDRIEIAEKCLRALPRR